MAKELKINLIVKDDGSVVIKNFSDQAAANLKKVEDAGRSMKTGFADTWQGMATGLNQATQLFQQVVGTLKPMVDAYMASETATMKLGIALKNQGSYTREALADFEDFATQMQKTTTVEDDLAKSIMGTLKSFGMTTEEVKRSTKAAADMAAFTGKSIETVADLLGKAYAGNTSALSRYGIVVDETIPKAEKFEAVLRQLEARFGGAAQAELETYSGQWKQIANIWGDMQEKAGYGILKTIQAATMSAAGMAAAGLAVVGALAYGDEQKAINNLYDAMAGFTKESYKAWMNTDQVSTALDKMGGQAVVTAQGMADAAQTTETYNKAVADVRKEAQSYLKELNSDLSAKKKHYADLQKMITENVEAEKKAAADKAEIRRQEIDVNQSAEKMIFQLSGKADKMTDVEKHAAALKELEDQYRAAAQKTGKEGVDALEEYKKNVVSLQNQYKNLEDATKNAEAAQRDVSLATAQQKSILADLEYQNFLATQASQEKGEALQAEAKKSKVGIEEVNASVKKLSEELAAFDKTLDIKAVDNASAVIDGIIAKMRQLKAENTALNMGSGGTASTAVATAKAAANPYLVTPGVSAGTPSAQLSDVSASASALAETADSASAAIDQAASEWTGMGISADGGQTWKNTSGQTYSVDVEGSYGLGTDYVPKTGKYILHQGEMVIPPGMADAIRSEDSRLAEMVTRVSGVIDATVAAVAAASIAVEQTAEDMADLIKRQFETFQSAFGSFTNYLESRERKSWGQAEYNAEFARLESQFGATEDFDRQIELLDQMLGVVQHLEDIEQAALEAQERMSAGLREQKQSISDWLVEISQGRLAPVQSAEGWAEEFNRMLANAAMNEEKVGEFLSYAQQYLEFAKVYGTDQSYGAAYSQVTSAVGSLGTYMDLASKLSDLGLGDNLSEINGLIQAFGVLGVSSADLTEAVNSVAGDVENASSLMVSASGSVPVAAELARVGIIPLATTLTSTLPAAVSQAIGTTGLQSLNMALVDAIPASIRTAIGSTGIGALEKSMIQVIPNAIAVATGSAGTESLAAALTSSIPESIKTAIGAQGMAALVSALTSTLPAAVSQAIGTTGLQSLNMALVDAIPASIRTAIGSTGIGALEKSMIQVIPNAIAVATGSAGTESLAAALTSSIPESIKTAIGAQGMAALVSALTSTLPAAVSQAIGTTGLQSLNMALVDAIPASIRTAIGSTGIGALEKSMIQVIPNAIAVATGSAGTESLAAALTSSIPESIKTAIGAQGMAALVSALTSTLPAAVANAVGAQGLATLATAIGTTIPTAAQAGVSGSEAVAQALAILQNAAATSTGTEGLGKLINALAATLPQSAIDSMEKAGLLARVLSDPTGTENMTSLVSTMVTNVKSQLATVAGFFDTLATSMGLTMNGGSVATAIAALTPPPVQVAATKSVLQTIETVPAGEGYWYYQYSAGGTYLGQTWVSGTPAHGKIIWSDGTIDNYGKGGLTSGTSIAGELGPEWVVPTYEPQKSKFLADVGADPDKIAAGVARMLGPNGPGAGGDSNVTVIVNLDGRQVASATAKQIRGGNTELIAALDGRIKARMN